MGCGSSTPAASPRSQAHLSRDELVHGLQELGRRLVQQRTQAKIIILGGGVQTIYLRTESSTPCIYVMDDMMPKNAKASLARAAAAVRTTHPKFPPNWFNQTAIKLNPTIRQRVVQEAKAQNVVMFQAAGIIAYAPPWKYGVVSRIDRLCGMQGNAVQTPTQARDANGAAHHLNQAMALAGAVWVDIDRLKRWQAHYGFKIHGNLNGALTAINTTYQKRFGSRPIRKSANDSRAPSPAPSARSARSDMSAGSNRSRVSNVSNRSARSPQSVASAQSGRGGATARGRGRGRGGGMGPTLSPPMSSH